MKKDRINIIYEDKFIIVVNKPSHLLTIATDNEKEKTLFHKVISYEKKKKKPYASFATVRFLTGKKIKKGTREDITVKQDRYGYDYHSAPMECTYKENHQN